MRARKQAMFYLFHLKEQPRKSQMDTKNSSPSLYSINSDYQGNAPWNIGKAQPSLIRLFDKYNLSGSVLDVGCGAGDLSISIAKRGCSVFGIDLSDKAIEICQSKISSLEPSIQSNIEFRLGDALNPSQLGRQFNSIVDSGFYHLFDQIERDKFAAELSMSLIPGGQYFLLGFAINSPLPNAPKQITKTEIEDRFSRSKGWNILEVEPSEFFTMLATPREKLPALSACIEKL
jgi:cyclopropane fatty-acyl-phospholipid synthase-like methyltransferase